MSRHRAVGDLLVLVGGQLAGRFLGFAAFAFIARMVDPAAYGGMEYIVGLSVFFALLIDGGLGPVAVREIATDPARTRAVASQIPALRAAIALLAAPIMAAVAYFTRHDPALFTLGLIFAGSLLAQAWNQEWLLQAHNKMASVSAAQIARSVVFALVVVLFVRSGDDILWVGAAECLGVATLIGVHAYVQHRTIGPIGFDFRSADVFRLAKQGAPLGGANIVWALHQYTPLILLANLVGPLETAWFAASHRIILSLLSFSNLYQFNLMPTLSRLHENDRARYDVIYAASQRVTGIFGAGLCLTLALLAVPMITVIYGARYAESGPVFAVLAWVLAFTLNGGNPRLALTVSRKQIYVLAAQLSGAVTGIVLAFAFIPRFGAIGGAYAMAGTALVVWMTAQIFSPKSGGSFLTAASAVALAMACWGATLFVDAHPLLEAIAALIVYAGGAFVLRRRILDDVTLVLGAKNDP